MSRFALLLSVLLVTTGACGDDASDGPPDAGGPPPHPDAAVSIADAATPDAADVPAPPDAGIVCAVPPAGYGDLGALSGMEADEDEEGVVSGVVRLARGTRPDVLFIALNPGEGVFAAGPLTTGTFDLSGDETSFEKCGACVFVLGDVGPNGPQGVFMARGGKLNLTSVAGRLTGTFDELTLVHVNEQTGTPIDDGCKTSISKASFDAVITTTPAGP